jgi:hypothetical protein
LQQAPSAVSGSSLAYLVVRGLSDDFPLHQFRFCLVRAAIDNLLCVSIPDARQLTKISVELGHRHFCGGVKTPCVKDLNEKLRKIAAGKLEVFQIAGIVQAAPKIRRAQTNFNYSEPNALNTRSANS